MLALPKHSAVLEVACGTRIDGIELAQAGMDVTSVDLSPEAVAQAAELANHVGVGSAIRFAAADAEHLPFPDRSFSASFVAASFHHFPNQQAALQEMRRVTKPGGYVIWGVEPAAWPYRTVYRVLAPVKRYIRAHRMRQHNSVADDSTEGYTRRSIERLFRNADLDILDLRPVKFLSEFYDSGTRLLGRLVRRPLRTSRAVDRGLARVDEWLSRIPGLTKIYWHFNVIGRVPSE